MTLLQLEADEDAQDELDQQENEDLAKTSSSEKSKRGRTEPMADQTKEPQALSQLAIGCTSRSETHFFLLFFDMNSRRRAVILWRRNARGPRVAGPRRLDCLEGAQSDIDFRSKKCLRRPCLLCQPPLAAGVLLLLSRGFWPARGPA